MTPSERIHWRYTFAGQIANGFVCYFGSIDYKAAAACADALLAALEASEPKPEPQQCEHEWVTYYASSMPFGEECKKCRECRD